MKIVRTSMTAIAAVLALSTFGMMGAAQAETVEIKTGVTGVVQASQSAVLQVGAASADAAGSVMNNSEVKAISAGTNNTVDIDQEIDANGANAENNTNFSLDFSGELHDNGTYATANGAAEATSGGLFGLGGSGSASNYGATSGSWQSGGALSGGVDYSSSYDLPSLSYATSTVGVNQVSVGLVGQLNLASATSGAVGDYSTLGATAVGQNNAANIKVVVKN